MSSTANKDNDSVNCNDSKRKYNSSSSSDTDNGKYLLVDNIEGYYTIASKLRSILVHPIGMMLTTLLNKVPPPKMPNEFWCGFDKENLHLKHGDVLVDRDHVLAAAVLKWEGKKVSQLSSTIHLYIDALSSEGKLEGYGSGDGDVLVVDEVYFESQDEKKCIFLVVSKAANDSNNDMKRSIVAIFYVSINPDKWWSKNDHLLQYVKSIRDENCKYIIDEPILLATISVSKPSVHRNDTTGSTQAIGMYNQLTDNNITSETDGKKISLTECYEQMKELTSVGCQPITCRVRFGTFLFIPEDEAEYCIAFLWRSDTCRLRTASAQFGNVLYSTNMCAQLREHFADVVSYDNLGPNCRKIGNLVSTHGIYSFDRFRNCDETSACSMP